MAEKHFLQELTLGQQDENEKRHEKKSALKENLLTLLTVAGVLAGSALGVILRSAKEEPWTEREVMYISFLGEIFLRMLKSLILPLIVASLVSAISGLDLSLSGKIAARAIGFYLITTMCSVILGMILVVTIAPGVGTDHDHQTQELKSRNVTTVDTLLDLVRYVINKYLKSFLSTGKQPILFFKRLKMHPFYHRVNA